MPTQVNPKTRTPKVIRTTGNFIFWRKFKTMISFYQKFLQLKRTWNTRSYPLFALVASFVPKVRTFAPIDTLTSRKTKFESVRQMYTLFSYFKSFCVGKDFDVIRIKRYNDVTDICNQQQSTYKNNSKYYHLARTGLLEMQDVHRRPRLLTTTIAIRQSSFLKSFAS